VPVEDDVVAGQPGLELGLEPGAPVAELGELDEMLELQVAYLVDDDLPPLSAAWRSAWG
jgi:hypothetical protein